MVHWIWQLLGNLYQISFSAVMGTIERVQNNELCDRGVKKSFKESEDGKGE